MLDTRDVEALMIKDDIWSMDVFLWVANLRANDGKERRGEESNIKDFGRHSQMKMHLRDISQA